MLILNNLIPIVAAGQVITKKTITTTTTTGFPFDEVTVLLAFAAVLVAVITIYQTAKNSRRDIRVDKLEELLQFMNYYYLHYESLFNLYKYAKYERFPSEFLNCPPITADQVRDIKMKFPLKDIEEKILRIQTLAIAYLPDNETKQKVISLNDAILKMSEYGLLGNSESTLYYYPNGYPTPTIQRAFIEEIEQGIIYEMKLGYQSITAASITEYRNKMQLRWNEINRDM